jgi:hypothetical protein
MVLAPSHSLAAECLQWDLGQVPEWHFKQGTTGVVNFTIQQHGDQLTGSGSHYFIPDTGASWRLPHLAVLPRVAFRPLA